MDEIGAAFRRAAELVRAWGEFRTPDGRTVSQTLTIEGVPLWAVLSPSLAFGQLSQILLEPTRRVGVVDRLRVLAKRARRRSRDVARAVVGTRRGCERWPPRPTFLFLGFSPHIYRDTLRPVATRMAARADCAAVVLDDVVEVRRRPPGEGRLEHQSLQDHWDAEVARTSTRMHRALAAALRQLAAPAGLPSVIAAGPLASMAPQFRLMFDWLFGVCLPRLVTQSAIAQHLIRRHHPALIVSPDVNDPRTRVFGAQGRLAGVRTLEIQFGFYGPNDIEWSFFEADRLAVTGPANLEVMRGHGVASERMTVTGSPRYDQVLSWSPQEARRTRERLGVPEGKRMVLFASQPFYFGVFSSPQIRLAMMKTLFEAVSKVEGLVLVVKPHPLESPQALADVARGSRNLLWAEGQEDIRELIKATDVFVTFFSGTAFDALVMNKPVINLAFPGACANTLFEDCGATTVARTAAQVEQLMGSVSRGALEELTRATSAPREAFLESWFHKLDGRAAERIEAIALELAASEGGRS